MTRSRVVGIGWVHSNRTYDFSRPDSVDWGAAEASPVGCDDDEASVAMCAAIDDARSAGDSIGGVFEIWCWGVCPGLGSHVRIEDRLDGRLLAAVGSIPAIKGVEIGLGFANAARRGSEVHDSFIVDKTDGASWISRDTNRAGGIEGGMSNGMPIIVRAAMKPIPTLTSALPSVDLATMQPTRAQVERSDVCAVPAARVVGEAMVACVIAASYLEKFGGDSLADLVGAVGCYEARLEGRGLWHRS